MRSGPEKISIRASRRTGDEKLERGVVKEIAYMGDVSVYLVKIDGGGRMVRVTRRTSSAADDRISWDETAGLSWHPSSPVVLTQ